MTANPSTSQGNRANPNLTEALRYVQAGVSVIPCGSEKLPASRMLPRKPDDPTRGTWDPFKQQIADERTIRMWFSRPGVLVAAICGKVSGDREGLDFDNKGHPSADELWAAWRAVVDAQAPGLVERLAIERSPGGGRHAFYRCEKIEGNQKLAMRPATAEEIVKKPKLRAVTQIETRGEGGYFVTAPSAGYVVEQGDLAHPPLVTIDERTIMLNAARSLNRYIDPTKMDQPIRPRKNAEKRDTGLGKPPWEDYDERGDVAVLLRQHGWCEVGRHGAGTAWRRPGKSVSMSATLGFDAGNPRTLYVFSSSAAPFEPEHGYSPSKVFALLEHNGDLKEAAKALRKDGYGDPLPPAEERRRPGRPRKDGALLTQHTRTALAGVDLTTGEILDEELREASVAAAAGGALPDEGDDLRPQIECVDMDIPYIAGQAWDALFEANAREENPILYRRGAGLVRLQWDDKGNPYLQEANDDILRGILSRVCVFQKTRFGKNGPTVQVEIPPKPIVADMLVNPHRETPPLTRIVTMPVFAPDGSLMVEPGYHPKASVFYEPRPGITVAPVSENPTAAEMEKARSLIIDDLLVDFPFVTASDRAHAIAFMLLPFVRTMIPAPTPLHLVESPIPGSGKGKLVIACMLPSMGSLPVGMSEAHEETDWGKKLTSTLRGSPALIWIDNVNREIDSANLAAMLTTTIWEDRILGSSEMMRLPIECVWAATGNNPTLSGEIARRTIRCRIDPKLAAPGLRTGFKHHPIEAWTLAQAGKLAHACLTMIRYGLRHGVPGQTLGSYAEWADMMGRILSGCGIPGFLENVATMNQRSTMDNMAWGELVAAWWAKHQTHDVQAADIYTIMEAEGIDLRLRGKTERALKTSFGLALGKKADSVITTMTDSGDAMHLRILAGGTAQRLKLWSLEMSDPNDVRITKFVPAPVPVQGDLLSPTPPPMATSSALEPAPSTTCSGTPDCPHVDLIAVVHNYLERYNWRAAQTVISEHPDHDWAEEQYVADVLRKDDESLPE